MAFGGTKSKPIPGPHEVYGFLVDGEVIFEDAVFASAK
jgi:hypothetical protein